MKTKTAQRSKVVQLTSPAPAHGGVCLATVTQWSDEGVEVALAHAPAESVAARVMLAPGVSLSGAAVAAGQRVVVLLDPSGVPVVLGVVQPIGAAPTAKDEARVEGRRVEVVAGDEIVLKCGEASLVMRRNGRVVLRGVEVETRAKGRHRIKGGTVAIN